MDDRPTSAWTRRDLLVLGLGAFVVASVPAAAARGRRRLVRRTLPVMGTLAEIAVVGEDGPAAERAIDAALARLSEVERAMTRYDDASDVGRANLGAAQDGVVVGEETARVLSEALRWAQASAGLFDPCLGRAVSAWDVENRREPLPAEAVRRWAGRGLYRALDLGRLRGQPAVRFSDPEVALDLGGIAKGFGVDEAARVLRAHGVTQAFVNVGGDLVALGGSLDGGPWRVGVQSPDDPARVLEVLEVRDQAVATSGDYLRGFTWHGRRYHHLLDPRSAEPWNGPQHSLTVLAPDCLSADAAATAAFGLPRASGDRLLSTCAPGARIVHSV